MGKLTYDFERFWRASGRRKGLNKRAFERGKYCQASWIASGMDHLRRPKAQHSRRPLCSDGGRRGCVS